MRTQPVRKTHSLPMRRSFLYKNTCLQEADEIIAKQIITGMNRRQIASEIYFHAVAFYICKALEKKRIHIRRILASADPVDLCDNGDTRFRRTVYRIVWHLPGKTEKKKEREKQ